MFLERDEGFTLLEVMIALAVLAGVVVTVLSTLNYHLGVASRSSDLVTASILGKKQDRGGSPLRASEPR